MSAVTIQQMADRVAALMGERLGVRGTGLAEKLARGGGRLPRRVRVAAEELSQAEQMSQTPKLLLLVDEGRVAVAYDICVRHLGGLRGGALGAVTGALGRVAASLALLALLIAGLLAWRGYL